MLCTFQNNFNIRKATEDWFSQKVAAKTANHNEHRIFRDIKGNYLSS